MATPAGFITPGIVVVMVVFVVTPVTVMTIMVTLMPITSGPADTTTDGCGRAKLPNAYLAAAPGNAYCSACPRDVGTGDARCVAEEAKASCGGSSVRLQWRRSGRGWEMRSTARACW